MATTTVTAPKTETQSYGLSRRVFRWIAIGLATSSSALIISTVSGVRMADLTRLGFLPFALAAIAATTRLGVQVFRFKLVVRGFAGLPDGSLKGSSTVRVASEFVALSTPSNIGGVILRAAWLSSKSVQPGRSVWIGYVETLMDMYVASVLAFTAAAFAFLRGAPWIGSSILLVGGIIVIGNSVAVLIVVMRASLTVPSRIFRILSRFLGQDRTDRIEAAVQEGTHTFGIAAKALFNRDRVPLALKGFTLTIMDATLSGMALWIILSNAGLKIDLFSSMFIAFGVGTLASLPVSIGGSGLSELAMQTYLATVYGFYSWAAVIVWRIATYHALLAVTGVVFVWLMMKVTGRSVRRPRVHMNTIEQFLEKARFR